MNYALPLGNSTTCPVVAPGRYLNRHGLITGATGQGKTVSLMVMVEGLHRLGVPTFVTDIKGDLSGLAAPSQSAAPGATYEWWPESAHVMPLDVYRKAGVPMSASIGDMGPALVARALGLSEAQSGVLEIAYALAADRCRPLDTLAADRCRPLDTLADLRALVNWCADNRAEVAKDYGLVTPASVAAIGRAILGLERSGGAAFFDYPSFDVADLVNGSAVNLLHCVELYRHPRLYGAVMLWLLDRLFQVLPEVGDLPLPRLALFIDEAHLLFTDCPPALLASLENTVRLIRSKGVGVYFVTQAPGDLPDAVSRQCHLRVQHALRAVTPRDRSMIRGAAESLPAGDGFRCIDAIEKLSPGVALVSVMGEDGMQTPTRITRMRLPRSRLSPLSDSERTALIDARHVHVVTPDPVDPQPPVVHWYTGIGWAGLAFAVGVCFVVGGFAAMLGGAWIGAASLALGVFVCLIAKDC